MENLNRDSKLKYDFEILENEKVDEPMSTQIKISNLPVKSNRGRKPKHKSVVPQAAESSEFLNSSLLPQDRADTSV